MHFYIVLEHMKLDTPTALQKCAAANEGAVDSHQLRNHYRQGNRAYIHPILSIVQQKLNGGLVKVHHVITVMPLQNFS